MKKKSIFPVTGFILVLWLSVALSAFSQSAARELVSGWYVRPPYQMEVRQGDLNVLTGLDIMISRELFSGTRYRPLFKPISWADSLEGLKEGTVDFVPGGYHLPERESFAHFSIPYRTEEMVLYFRSDITEIADIDTLEGLSSHLSLTPYKMAYTSGFAYGNEEITHFFDNPPPALTRVSSSGYAETLHLLNLRRVDFFIANPVVMDRLLIKHDMREIVRKGFTVSRTGAHFLFSKKTITPDQVRDFNNRLRQMKEDGTLRRIHIDTILPFYISITTTQPWFRIVTLLGIIAFSLSGVLLARREHYNLFGALVLGTLPAIGGGVLRDILLGTGQIFVLKTPLYFLTAIGAVVLAFLGFKLVDRLAERPSKGFKQVHRNRRQFAGFFGRLFQFFDAWAVAAFTIIGVSVAIEMRATPLWLWGPAMGVLTASGGVVLRDVVRSDLNIEMLKKDSYAEISILGGVAYTGILIWFPDQFSANYNAMITIGFIILLFSFRFLFLWSGWENPFQVGSYRNRPELRLEKIRSKEQALRAQLPDVYPATGAENALFDGVPAAKLESLHNRFFYAFSAVQADLNDLIPEGLDAGKRREYRLIVQRVNLLFELEQTLYAVSRNEDKMVPEQAATSEPIHQKLERVLVQVNEIASDPKPEAMDCFYKQIHETETEIQLYRKVGSQNLSPENQTGVIRMAYQAERICFLATEYIRSFGRESRLAPGGARGA